MRQSLSLYSVVTRLRRLVAAALSLDKRLAVNTLADLRVRLVSSDSDLAEGAVVLALAVVNALLDGAFDRRVRSLVFQFRFLF